MMTADSQLLHDYAQRKSQDAFAELVRRHVNLVYSAAMRQVRSPLLAEEISQSVFADLARAAGKLKPDTIITAWLYQVTRRTAIDVIRRESRQRARERLAAEMAAMNTAADWTHIEPILDEAMEALDETDRTAILLRYFENKSLREVGESLGTSDDAAQKRVSRAVERLREFFSKRGIAIAASGLAVLISANAVQAAPVALAATIATAAITGTAMHASTAVATKAIATTAFQKMVLTGTAVVVLAGAGTYEVRHASQLREQAKTLREEQSRLKETQAHLNEQLAHLQQEKSSLSNTLVSLTDDKEQLKRHLAELLKLRAEVQSLRQATNELQDHSAESVSFESSVVTQQQALHKNHLTQAWVNAFMGYATNHEGKFPDTFEQARPFFSPPDDGGSGEDENYKILYHGSLNDLNNRLVVLFREKKIWQNEKGVWGRYDVLATGPWPRTGQNCVVRYLSEPVNDPANAAVNLSPFE
ncbi:MAG TPA: sigma-70 family RNA polymerase sigma factor [Candidatus Polarisedimenticolia bacterium]|nr:sigma-70 family RNA polymerase sigma factor [Candidatus Polarisedimenticolia bacterium]